MVKAGTILFISIILFFGCVQSPAPGTGNAVLSDENPDTELQEVSLNIVVGDFEPGEITVKKGVPVELTLTAVEIDPDFDTHGFAIKELGIDEKIGIGESKTVTFTPDVAGDFVFFCSNFCGQGHIGQAGILHVVE